MTFQQFEGGGSGDFYSDIMSGSVKTEMQPGQRDARSQMTIGSTVLRPPSPDSHEDPKKSVASSMFAYLTHWRCLSSRSGTQNPQLEAEIHRSSNVTIPVKTRFFSERAPVP